MSLFQKELETLLNKHSKENESDTCDFILSEYIIMCLDAFNAATKSRDEWYSPKTIIEQKIIEPGGGWCILKKQ